MCKETKLCIISDFNESDIMHNLKLKDKKQDKKQSKENSVTVDDNILNIKLSTATDIVIEKNMKTKRYEFAILLSAGQIYLKEYNKKENGDKLKDLYILDFKQAIACDLSISDFIINKINKTMKDECELFETTIHNFLCKFCSKLKTSDVFNLLQNFWRQLPYWFLEIIMNVYESKADKRYTQKANVFSFCVYANVLAILASANVNIKDFKKDNKTFTSSKNMMKLFTIADNVFKENINSYKNLYLKLNAVGYSCNVLSLYMANNTFMIEELFLVKLFSYFGIKRFNCQTFFNSNKELKNVECLCTDLLEESYINIVNDLSILPTFKNTAKLNLILNFNVAYTVKSSDKFNGKFEHLNLSNCSVFKKVTNINNTLDAAYRYFLKYEKSRGTNEATILLHKSIKLLYKLLPVHSSYRYTKDTRNANFLYNSDTKEYCYKLDLKRILIYLMNSFSKNFTCLNTLNTIGVSDDSLLSLCNDENNLLFDYYYMAENVDGFIRDYYPHNLQKAHNLYSKLYQFKRNEKKILKFQEISTSLKKLECSFEDYSLIAPQSIDDIVKEGKELSHCVASYIDKILDEKSSIFFLRENRALDCPLVTVEISYDESNSCFSKLQASGLSNRRISKKESNVINEWLNVINKKAKKKGGFLSERCSK